MSAILQIYKSPACTPADELNIAGADYDLTIGPNTGLDGDTGDRADMALYLKNTGNRPAIDIRLTKANDIADMAQFKTAAMTSYVPDALSVGDLLPTEVIAVYVRVTVPSGTPAVLIAPNFTLKFKSLP